MIEIISVEEYVVNQMVVALWDMVGKAANLAQVLGLDAVTLITIAMSFLRFHQARKECRKLEGRVRMLRLLLLTSVGGHWITQQQQNDDLEVVANVLRDASDLVESYKRSTLYARVVRGGRGMATRFRDVRSRVDSCSHLILAVDAFLLVVQPPNRLQNHAPPSPLVIRTEGSDADSVDAAQPSTIATDRVDHVVIDISQE